MPLVRKDPVEPAPPHGARAEALSALTRGTSDERWAAARILGAAAGEAEALSHALSREADARVREAIFSSLTRAHSLESVEAILPHLRSDDAGLRAGALDALRALPAVVAPRLVGLLCDPDPDVRLLACEIVRSLPDGEATTLLCVLLDGEDHVNVCGAAVEVLAEVGGPEAIPALARCADRFTHEPFLVFAIKAALVRVGAPSGVSTG